MARVKGEVWIAGKRAAVRVGDVDQFDSEDALALMASHETLRRERDALYRALVKATDEMYAQSVLRAATPNRGSASEGSNGE